MSRCFSIYLKLSYEIEMKRSATNFDRPTEEKLETNEWSKSIRPETGFLSRHVEEFLSSLAVSLSVEKQSSFRGSRMTRRRAPRWRKDDAHDWDPGDRRKSLENEMAVHVGEQTPAQVGETCNGSISDTLPGGETISALRLPSPFSSPRCPFAAISLSSALLPLHGTQPVQNSPNYHARPANYEFQSLAPLNLRVPSNDNEQRWSFAILFHAFGNWNVYTRRSH